MALSGKCYDAQATTEHKQQLELTVRSSATTLDLLTQVLEQQIEHLQANKFEDYTLPGWDYRQADRNGQIRALRDVLKMTKLDPKGV